MLVLGGQSLMVEFQLPSRFSFHPAKRENTNEMAATLVPIQVWMHQEDGMGNLISWGSVGQLVAASVNK